jgi:hypothetical protein
VVLGTATVGFAAATARLWASRRAAVATAWLLALAPSQVYFTSVAMTETLQATLAVGAVLAGTLLARSVAPAAAHRGRWIAFGALAGFAGLVNPGGILLALVPALAVRGRTGRWTGAGRGAAHIAVGLVVLLLPWTVRNGLQVGVWSPGPSSNAVAICAGHRDAAYGGAPKSDDPLADCFTRRPARPGQTVSDTLNEWEASDPDEGEWYQENVRQAARWALDNPDDELRLVPLKVWETVRTDQESFSAAEDFGGQPLGPWRLRNFFVTIGEAWYFSVLVLTGLALALDRRARRAWPLWGIPLVTLLGVIPTHGSPRYHHPMVAVLVVLAGMALAALHAGTRPTPDKGEPTAKLRTSGAPGAPDVRSLPEEPA